MIYLGNLTVDQFIQRTGYKLSNEDRRWLEAHRSNNATIRSDNSAFHIFDLPFSIHVSKNLIDQLMSKLRVYESVQPSNEPLQVVTVNDSAEEQREREASAYERKQQELRVNPNNVWNVKWHMMVKVNDNLFYRCFINTYTKGYMNIPSTIDGSFWIERSSNGLRGTFILEDPESMDDANTNPDWNYVVGIGFYDSSGKKLHSDITFERIQSSIHDVIELYKQILGYTGSGREIHFDKELKETIK